MTHKLLMKMGQTPLCQLFMSTRLITIHHCLINNPKLTKNYNLKLPVTLTKLPILVDLTNIKKRFKLFDIKILIKSFKFEILVESVILQLLIEIADIKILLN